MVRRVAGAITGALVGAAFSSTIAAAPAPDTHGYPARPIRIVAPFPPGSGVDIVARAIAQSLTDAWRQSVIVDNRPGAGGTIAGDMVAKANADGYTLMLGNVSTLAIARSLYPRLAYDPLKDFAPITLITTSENVIVVHPSVPVDSVKALIDYAKARPRQINYGSAGSGTTTHLGGAMFSSMAGVDITHVPYKGSQQMLVDLLSGQVQLSFSSVPTALPHIKSGRLRPLAVTRLTRSKTLPELPTVHEAGVRGFDISLWQGIVAPAGTPRLIVMKLNQQIVANLGTPHLKQQFEAQGLQPVGNTPEEFGAYIKAEADKWAKVVKASGAKPE
ncbi:MAG TPA: tripartite tricarboxylate transporter substrate binding protein [Burkholderiales bacterium]|nr:tripartite tricarboxylate transporter substrate binding protein [Burkholderiales bacterium]